MFAPNPVQDLGIQGLTDQKDSADAVPEAAYHRVTLSLGFGSTLRPVNMRPQKLRIDHCGADNSFATDKQDEIRLGKGGVDDAEDGEVILHDYGHAIHFSQRLPVLDRGGRRDQRGLRRLLG